MGRNRFKVGRVDRSKLGVGNFPQNDPRLARLLKETALSSSSPFPDFAAMSARSAARAKKRWTAFGVTAGLAAVLTAGFLSGTLLGTPRLFQKDEALVRYWTAPETETPRQPLGSYISYLWDSTSDNEIQ